MGLVHVQVLKSKPSVVTRCDSTLDLRSLNRNGAASTTWVIKGQIGIGPTACSDHRRSQSLLQRCLAFFGSPSPLEQRLTRGVHKEQHRILGQVHINTHLRPLHINVWSRPSPFSEPIGHCVLHAKGCKVQTLQGTVLRGDVHFEGEFFAEPHLPWNGGSSLVDVVLALVPRLFELDQHALAKPCVQVELHHLAPRSLHQQASALRAHAPWRIIQNASHLSLQIGLNAGCAR